MDNMDNYKDQFKDHDFFYCCLGSKVGRGKELFLKVDYHYPLYFADLAISVGAKAYFLVSSIGAKSTSWNFYLETKGKVEADMKSKDHKNLIILRPGGLTGRKNGGCTDCIAAVFCCFPKNTLENVAKCMIMCSQNILKDDSTGIDEMMNATAINKEAGRYGNKE